jgi:hypothetical protein
MLSPVFAQFQRFAASVTRRGLSPGPGCNVNGLHFNSLFGEAAYWHALCHDPIGTINMESLTWHHVHSLLRHAQLRC